MDFSFENCIISEHSFPARQVRGLLQNKDAMDFILLDLLKFEEEANKLGEKKIVLNYFSCQEQIYWEKLTSAKRKREWLGGRIAAKYIAVKTLELAGRQNISPLWIDLEIMPNEKGRPFLCIDEIDSLLPDISISHSGTMAAAMSTNRGLCGIDIQEITPRILKVNDRFCTPDEKQILQEFFTFSDRKITLLTKLWAAKEALRKVSNLPSLPGFLELRLVKIMAGSSSSEQGPWKFILLWKNRKLEVTITLVENYALALTSMSDTVK